MDYEGWERWEEEGWTDWKSLSDADKEKISDNPGVYVVSTHKRLNRAFGADKHGILDIGESDNLSKRIKAFTSCARGSRQKGHMAGWRYRNFNFNKVFPLDTLYICWKECASKEDAYALEGKLLNEYMNQHYELPPLNYKFNWSE